MRDAGADLRFRWAVAISLVTGLMAGISIAAGVLDGRFALLLAVIALMPVAVFKLKKQKSAGLEGFSSPLLKKLIQAYITSEQANISSIIDSIRSGTVYLDFDHYKRLIEILFSSNVNHLALDGSLPSEYSARYPGALELQSKTQSRKILETNCRILMHSVDDLILDAKNPAYSDFFDWHNENGVELKHLSNEECMDIIRSCGIDPANCTHGISLFGDEYAILFSRDSEGLLKIMIYESNDELFRDIKSAWKQLHRRSTKVERFGSYFKLNAATIENYLEYVNPEERWKKINALIRSFIAPCRRNGKVVLDAASGMGFEFYKLLQEGYAVDANEVMPALRESGRNFYKKMGYETDYLPTSHTWGKMAEIGWESKYGAVLVIGNSIRMQDTLGQKKSFKSFYKILQKGGILIIDERNFGIFEEKKEIIVRCNSNPDDPDLFRAAFNIQNTHNSMFVGTNFVSVPFDASEKTVHFCYYKQSPKITTLTEAKKNMIIHSEMHYSEPVEKLLKEAGFTEIRKFADYDLGQELRPDEPSKKAQVFVYVAIK